MRYLLVVIVFALFAIFTSCSGNANLNNTVKVALPDEDQHLVADSLKREGGAYLNLVSGQYDFGTVKSAKVPALTIDFGFENKGDSPLIILKADVSCGCLSVKYPREPIYPGGKSKLTVSVDLKNQNGFFNKTIFIKSNAVNDLELIRIKGTVK